MTGTDETQLGDDFSYIIRIADTDVDGLRKISVGLCSIKGIGMRTAEMICRLSGVDGSKLGGHLSDEEQDKLRDSIGTYATEMPWWLMNRQRDLETNEDAHIVALEVKMTRDDDVARMIIATGHIASRRLDAARDALHGLQQPEGYDEPELLAFVC